VSRCGQISLFDPSILVTRRKRSKFNELHLIKRKSHGGVKSREIHGNRCHYKKTLSGYMQHRDGKLKS
jgi:hypothetical protein